MISLPSILRPRRRRMSGHLRLWGPDGRILADTHNMIVNGGPLAAAELFSIPSGAAYAPTLLGFGSGSTAPLVSDTDLAGPVKYYNSLVSGAPVAGQNGSVQFGYQLASTEYAANGIVVSEIGIFANSASAVFPSGVGFSYSTWGGGASKVVGATVTDGSSHVFASVAPPVWPSNTSVAQYRLITDSNGNLQECTSAGSTTNGAHPTWNTNLNGTTTDNGATWTCKGLSGYTPTTGGGGAPSWVTTAIGAYTWDNTVAWQYVEAIGTVPGTMIAHALVPAFTFAAGAGGYTGAWIITF